MPNTQWGTLITYGWELEGHTDSILNWYRPESYLNNEQWLKLSQAEKSREAASARRNPGGWSNFVRIQSGRVPPYISDRLRQEVFEPTWEICSTQYPTTVEGLFLQMNAAKRVLALGDEWESFQVHIVFERPSLTDLKTNAQLASLYQLLNDYAFAKLVRRGPAGFSRLLGAPGHPLEYVVNDMQSGDRFDGLDRRGASVGPYKFNYVGLRDLYGNNRMGFEIRAGWQQKRAAGFRSLIERVTEALMYLDRPINIKRRRASGAGSYTLLEHYDFHIQRLEEGLSLDLMGKLKKEADDVWQDFKNDPRKTQFSYPMSAKILFERWLLAFAPWEFHPSIAVDISNVVSVQFARKVAMKKLDRYFGGELSDKPGESPHFVTELAQSVLRFSNIHSFL